MARKTRVVIKRKDGTTASFLAKNKVTRKVSRPSKSKPATRRVGAASTSKKRSTQKQRDAAANARAIQKARKSMPGAYGLGYIRGRAVEGPAGPPAGYSGVASLTAPSAPVYKTGNPYAEIGTPSAVKSGNPYADIGV